MDAKDVQLVLEDLAAELEPLQFDGGGIRRDVFACVDVNESGRAVVEIYRAYGYGTQYHIFAGSVLLGDAKDIGRRLVDGDGTNAEPAEFVMWPELLTRDNRTWDS